MIYVLVLNRTSSSWYTASFRPVEREAVDRASMFPLWWPHASPLTDSISGLAIHTLNDTRHLWESARWKLAKLPLMNQTYKMRSFLESIILSPSYYLPSMPNAASTSTTATEPSECLLHEIRKHKGAAVGRHTAKFKENAPAAACLTGLLNAQRSRSIMSGTSSTPSPVRTHVASCSDSITERLIVENFDSQRVTHLKNADVEYIEEDAIMIVHISQEA